MIKLNALTEASIKISGEAHSKLQWSDKALFDLMYKDYKSVDKKSRGQVTLLLNKAICDNNASTNVQNALKIISKMAFNYVDMQVIARFDGLEYSNIAGLVKLFKYVDKHIEDKSKELRETIKGLYESDMSSHRYNNVVASKIVELKEEYKLKDTEDEFIVLDFFDTVSTNMSKMTDEDVLKLLDIVQSRVDRIQIAA